MGCAKVTHLRLTKSRFCVLCVRIRGGGAVKYEVDTGVRPALQQAGAFGESKK